MKSLSTHITESFNINEAKSKTLSGLTFDYQGATHTIDYIDGDFVTTTKGREYRISSIEKHGVVMPTKDKPAKLISKSDYDKICKNAWDTKNSDNTLEIAQKLFENPDVSNRLKKDYPSKNTEELVNELMLDIESYDTSYEAAVAGKAKRRATMYTPAQYRSILKGAVKDAGGAENAHDMAQSMIYDNGIKARLLKDYPNIRRESDLIKRLQWDLEAYD